MQLLSRPEASYRIDDCKPSPDRALSIVFVSLRMTEQNEDAVAQISGDGPCKSSDRLGNRQLIGADQLAQILGK